MQYRLSLLLVIILIGGCSSAPTATAPPEMFWFGWSADVNDPDNFLLEIIHSGSQSNYGKFTNSEFDELVEKAANSRNPAKRQELYIQAERLLSEPEAVLIPLYHTK